MVQQPSQPQSGEMHCLCAAGPGLMQDQHVHLRRPGRRLPNGDVVVDGLRAERGEVDEDAVARRDPDVPHAVLKVGVLGGVAW